MPRFESAQRAKILEAAISVFAEQGLNGATTRTVAKAAGVNSALIYYYFENKDTLFTEALRMVMRGLIEQLSQNKREFVDGRDRLSFLINGLYDYYGSHPARMRLMGVAVTLYPDLLGKVIQDFAEEKVVLPIETLEEGMNCGELRRLHPLQVWWSSLGACLLSLQMRRVMEHVKTSNALLEVPDLTDARTENIDVLCDGLVASKSAASLRNHAKRKSTP